MPKASRTLLGALLLWTAGASGADRIIWLSIDEPPSVIAEGGFAGRGGEELEGGILARALPGFDWTLAKAAPPRIIHEIETRDGICSFGFARVPGREDVMLFSARPMETPGYGLIVREDRLVDFQPYRDPTGAIDLARLAGAPLVGGYVGVRPHLDALKTFLEAHHAQPRLVPAVDSPSLYRQVVGRRIDFLFGLRDETAYFAAELGAEVRLVSLPIAGIDRWTPASIACSKGPAGRRVIAAIDGWLVDDRHWAEFMDPWRPWLSDEDYAAAIRGPAGIDGH